jgi:hypothetical protein
MSTALTDSERDQIATILTRRANEVAGFKNNYKEALASVDYACELEIKHLRKLADKVNPPKPEEDEE